MKNLLLILGFFALCAAAFLSPQFLKSLIPGTEKDMLTGSWFGIVDVRSLNQPLPALEENEGNAVMRIVWSPTILTHLQTYKGQGELTDDQGQIQRVTFTDVSVLNSGRIAGFLQQDGAAGSIEGDLASGKLTLNSGTKTFTFHLQGILRPGDESDYQALCRRMQTTDKTGKEKPISGVRAHGSQLSGSTISPTCGSKNTLPTPLALPTTSSLFAICSAFALLPASAISPTSDSMLPES